MQTRLCQADANVHADAKANGIWNKNSTFPSPLGLLEREEVWYNIPDNSDILGVDETIEIPHTFFNNDIS